MLALQAFVSRVLPIQNSYREGLHIVKALLDLGYISRKHDTGKELRALQTNQQGSNFLENFVLEIIQFGFMYSYYVLHYNKKTIEELLELKPAFQFKSTGVKV